MSGESPLAHGLRPEIAPPGAPPRRPTARQLAISVLLLVVTLFTSTTLGAGWYLSTRTDVTTDLLPWLSPETVGEVWSDPGLLRLGLSFSLPLLFILLCHELGHYVACRIHSLPATLPFFIPAPLGLGTFGAFIRIRGLVRTRGQLLDVGAAGPIAGFLALLPFLLVGMARSTVADIAVAPDFQATPFALWLPGRNLALMLAAHAVQGRSDLPLDLHPFALAAWVGLLATALNLLPLGQLDGGHILYAALGRLQRLLALPLWLALAATSFLWPGWIVWCALVLLLGLVHPPVLREDVPLGPARLLIAAIALLLFVLSFIPVPLTMVPVYVG
jgi:membrane-associated protease RseP (regulator of RpoE activity)